MHCSNFLRNCSRMFTENENRNRKPGIKKDKCKICSFDVICSGNLFFSAFRHFKRGCYFRWCLCLSFNCPTTQPCTVHSQPTSKLWTAQLFEWRQRDLRNFKWYGLRIMLNRIASDENDYVLNVWTLIVYYCSQFVGAVVDAHANAAAGATHDKNDSTEQRETESDDVFLLRVSTQTPSTHQCPPNDTMGIFEVAKRVQSSARIRVFSLFIELITKSAHTDAIAYLFVCVGEDKCRSKAQQTHRYSDAAHAHTKEWKATNCCCYCYWAEKNGWKMLVEYNHEALKHRKRKRALRHDFYGSICICARVWFDDGIQKETNRFRWFSMLSGAYRRSPLAVVEAYDFMSFSICGQFHRWEAKLKCGGHAVAGRPPWQNAMVNPFAVFLRLARISYHCVSLCARWINEALESSSDY